MRIKESRNLKYDKIAKVILEPDDYDKFALQPRVCILDKFERLNDALVLHFKNGSRATIKARNVEGAKEIDLIQSKLEELINHSYEEILDTELT